MSSIPAASARMTSPFAAHNRFVREEALRRGYVTREQLHHATAGKPPEEIAEDLAALLHREGLIDAAQRDALSLGATVPGSSQAATQSVSVTAEEIRRARTMTDSDVGRIERFREGKADDLIGVNLGGYRVERKIATGGMGEVYEATQLALGRRVALKVLPRALASRPAFIDRFYREARTLASFTHANIVQVHDVGETQGVHYFTMEQVHGNSFRDLLTDEGIPVPILTNLMKQSIRGLARAQQAGVIHRDVKPGNLLIGEQGDVKLVDFGLAETIEEAGAGAAEPLVGTPLYLAPEQVTGEGLSFRSDMYALGATFFHLCTGQPPFRAKTAMETARLHIDAPVPNASDVNSNVPRGFAAILAKMMAKNPEARYASYEELFEAVEQFELQSGIIKAPTGFLADSLLASGDVSVRGLAQKIAYMAFLGTAVALLAIGLHNLLAGQALHRWIGRFGDLATVFFALTLLFISYVAMARRRMLPVIGRIQLWMYAHIGSALLAFLFAMIHSGNFFRFFVSQGMRQHIYADRIHFSVVPVIAFLNSFVFLVVIVSGLVGATIWRDVLKQATMERIRRGGQPARADSQTTLAIFSQRVFRYWRVIHYPLAVTLTVLTILHIASILYYRGV